MTVPNPLRVAVLINTYDNPTIPAMKQSFVNAVKTASPDVEIDFYDPIVAQVYPDPVSYDLLVFSGGTENMIGLAGILKPWVAKMQEFVRNTVESHPNQKMMGICWGHQTICVSLGGVVESMGKSELGVTNVSLTAAGASFFKLPSNQLHIHEFHKRKVVNPARGFIPLADDGQSFINAENTIITFQGHPELNPELAKAMLKTAPSYMFVDIDEKEAVAKTMDNEHDGQVIWKRVMEWIGEK